MNDTTTPMAEAASLLASSFFEVVCEEGVDFEAFESRCISLGHSMIADAMSMALERFDARLCLGLPEGCRVHDRREKTLASEVGDLKFRYRRVRDRFGLSKTIWIYTGCILEKELKAESRWRTEVTDEILAMTDVLVDGRFVEALKDISLRFRGSSNQRILRLR